MDIAALKPDVIKTGFAGLLALNLTSFEWHHVIGIATILFQAAIYLHQNRKNRTKPQ